MTTPAAAVPRDLLDRLTSTSRLRALAETRLMDAAPDEAFDRLVRVAARSLDVPVALISLVDGERQFFVSATGLAEPWSSRRGTDLSRSICKHVVATERPVVVTDGPRDARVSSNAAVVARDVIAYAGVPLRSTDGETLGALCAIDERPRTWTDEDLETLEVLSRAVSSEVALRLAATRQRKLLSQARHRFATPLTALLLELEQAAGRAPEDTDLRTQLEDARAQVRRLATDFESLLVNSSAAPFGHEDDIELMELLTTVAADWNGRAAGERWRLSVAPHPAVHLRAAVTALRDALNELIATAHSDAGRTIVLAVSEDPTTTRIRVSFGEQPIPVGTLAGLLRRQDQAPVEPMPAAPEEPGQSLAETVLLRLGARLVVGSGNRNTVEIVFVRP